VVVVGAVRVLGVVELPSFPRYLRLGEYVIAGRAGGEKENETAVAVGTPEQAGAVGKIVAMEEAEAGERVRAGVPGHRLRGRCRAGQTWNIRDSTHTFSISLGVAPRGISRGKWSGARSGSADTPKGVEGQSPSFPELGQAIERCPHSSTTKAFS
jgi:hypothetical protein